MSLEPPSDPSDSTQAFDLKGTQGDHARPDDRPLFERYEPRSLRTIVAQQRALRESHAAAAAKVILEGIEPPEFDFEHEQVHAVVEIDTGARPLYRSIRVQRVTLMGRLVSPGAQFIYALLIIMALSGILALAVSTSSPQLILVAGIATPMLLPVCIWKWIRWLDSDPYYYRLLTSLGEDARDLLQYRLFWKKSPSGR